MSRNFLLLLLSFIFISCEDLYDSETGILKDVLGQVRYKVDVINDIDKGGGSFIFITDTHITSNCINSPQQIRYILQNTSLDKVIWGGDAISAYGNNIEEQWEWHCNSFDANIKGYGNLYKVRGNHEFTIRESADSNNRRTLSQYQTFQYLFEYAPNNIVRNNGDPEGCYYYFDDIINKIRYIILETDYTVYEGNIPSGVLDGVHDVQLSWIANSAIATTLSNYSIIFISHIPITDTTTNQNTTFRNVLQLVNAINSKATGNIGSVNFDFSSLDNVRVLLYLSGDMHHDMQTYQSGVLHVVTASDAAYGDYLADPFVVDKSGRYGANAQCFDCVCIDKEKENISFIRFGIGGNRLFHLQPISLKVGEGRLINTTQGGKEITWYSYDSSGNSYINGRWNLNNTIIAVDNHGMVKGQQPGEAVVLNMNEKGDKEYYYIIVEG